MSLINRYGDLEISDPQALRALAHPTRLAILERLQRHGPSTASRLAPHVGATPSVVSWHLRHLAGFGLVKDWDGAGSKRERGWQAAARGYRFVPREGDAEAHEAARQLSMEHFAATAEVPMRWLEHDEPRLSPKWQELSGLANTLIRLTADELEALEDGIEQLIAPFVNRPEADAPQDARNVRLLRYTLAEADES